MSTVFLEEVHNDAFIHHSYNIYIFMRTGHASLYALGGRPGIEGGWANRMT